MSVPHCFKVHSSEGRYYYDGDWGQCSFNYQKKASLWAFISFIVTTILWFLLNEFCRVLIKENLEGILAGLAFATVIIFSIGIFMALQGRVVQIIHDHIYMEVKRRQEWEKLE